MKKIVMTLAAVLCCAMTTTVFTACSSDDDDNKNNTSQDLPASGVMECTLSSSNETIASFDIYLKYYDENGKIQTEKAVWSNTANSEGVRTWTKTVTAKLPATLGAYMEIKAKEGIDTEAQYVISRGYNIKFKSLTASGKEIDQYTPNAVYTSSQNRKGMLEDALKALSNRLNIIYQYDANGRGAGIRTWE